MSALTARGSTRRWRELRHHVATQLAAAGTLPCTRCGQPVDATGRWDLDHRIPRSAGGTDRPDNLGPAHPVCNRAAQRQTATLPASRDW